LIPVPRPIPGINRWQWYREASYIISIDASGYVRAVNGRTGYVDFEGTDASTVIQAAINALTAGGKIFIKAGTYPILTSINVNKHNVMIQGEGKDATILQDNSSTGIDIISLSNPAGETELRNIVLEDFSVYGKSTAVSGDLISYKGEGIDSLSVRRVKFRYVASGKYALYLRHVHHTLIQECTFITFADGGRGVYLLADVSDKTVDNITFIRNNFFTGNANVVFVYANRTAGSLRRVDFYSNIFWGSSDKSGTIGIKCYGAGQGWMNIIANNFEEMWRAIEITGMNNIYIKGNYIFSRFPTFFTGQKGIYLDSNTRNCQVIGNYFEGYTPTVTYSTGVDDKNTGLPPNIVELNSFNYLDRPVLLASGATTKMRRNYGYATENSVLSPTFAIDSTGIKTVTIPHGLNITPAKEDCALTVVEETDVDDWRYDFLKVDTIDATNVTVKVNVCQASATAGATARLALRVGEP
jgi:hypothetical protein